MRQPERRVRVPKEQYNAEEKDQEMRVETNHRGWVNRAIKARKVRLSGRKDRFAEDRPIGDEFLAPNGIPKGPTLVIKRVVDQGTH